MNYFFPVSSQMAEMKDTIGIHCVVQCGENGRGASFKNNHWPAVVGKYEIFLAKGKLSACQ